MSTTTSQEQISNEVVKKPRSRKTKHDEGHQVERAKRGRKMKYSSAEERIDARRKQQREYILILISVEHLGFIPIISFKFNGDRRIYKKQPLQKLIIRNKLNEFQDKQFYSNKIMVVTDNSVIDKIKAAIPEKKSIVLDDEIELFE